MASRTYEWDDSSKYSLGGEALTLAAGKMKASMGDGLDQTIKDIYNRREATSQKNLTDLTEANTGAYIDAIRNGKKADMTGPYNSKQVSDASYEYEKYQTAQAFKRRAEGRAIAAAARARKGSGTGTVGVGNNTPVPNLYGGTPTPAAVEESKNLAPSIFEVGATPKEVSSVTSADTARMLMAAAKNKDEIPFVEQGGSEFGITKAPAYPGEIVPEADDLTSTDLWKAENPNFGNKGYPLPREKAAEEMYDFYNGKNDVEGQVLDQTVANWRRRNPNPGSSGPGYTPAPIEPSAEDFMMRRAAEINAKTTEGYVPQDPHAAMNPALWAQQQENGVNESAAARDALLAAAAEKKAIQDHRVTNIPEQVRVPGDNMTVKMENMMDELTEDPMEPLYDPNDMTPEEIAAGNEMEKVKNQLLNKQIDDEEMAAEEREDKTFDYKADFENEMEAQAEKRIESHQNSELSNQANTKSKAEAKKATEKATAAQIASMKAIMRGGSKTETAKAAKKAETKINKTALEKVVEAKKQKESGKLTSAQQKAYDAETKMVASAQKVEANYIKDRQDAENVYIKYSSSVDSSTLKNSEKKWRKAQAKNQRDQYLNTLKIKYDQDTKLNLTEKLILDRQKKAADDAAAEAKTIRTENRSDKRSIKTSRQKLVDKGEGKWVGNKFIATPKKKKGDSAYFNAAKLQIKDGNGYRNADLDSDDVGAFNALSKTAKNQGISKETFNNYMQTAAINPDMLSDDEARKPGYWPWKSSGDTKAIRENFSDWLETYSPKEYTKFNKLRK